MKSYDFEIEMDVRDYELDTQGLVNNSVYQQYLEHARHQLLKKLGLNFNEMHNNGVDAVVHKAELVYKKPLMGDDSFVVRSSIRQSGNVRFLFDQDIYRRPDETLMLTGVVTTVFMSGGRPIRPPEEVVEALKKYRKSHE
ncbi:MAG: YbgC/FadM family acyl-CoA thioesterase [Bacteroidetes bacterium]|jgi:acyl-CoA thioester hydrolase|nr:YbgC/FadM family acyl-CoA thioesterase [Bacteroidota bacterium]